MNIAEVNEPFAKGIMQIIEEKNCKKSAIAKSAGYTTQQFSDMLCGRKVIRAIDLLRISRALDVTMDEIEAKKESREEGVIEGVSKIIVETDKENPETIALITSSEVDTAAGFRVRITPNYP